MRQHKRLFIIVMTVGLLLVVATGAIAQTGDNPLPQPASDQYLVSGQIQNATTDQAAAEPLTVELHAFDSSFTRTETIETTSDEDGRFQFTLDAIEPDWVYMTTVTYGGLEYSSDIGRLNGDQPTLDLPLTVFEQTMDETAVSLNQLHITVALMGEQVRVSELYTFDNKETAVFVGASGTTDEGTVRLALPDVAQSPDFQRGFGGDNFFPANEILQTDAGWADTLPLRPGPGSLTLLVNYVVPSQGNLQLTRSLPYDTHNVTLVVPDGLAPGSAWQQDPSRMTGSGVTTSFSLASLTAGETLDIRLEGQPAALAAPGGSALSPWLAAAGVLLLVGLAAGRMVYLRRQNGETALKPEGVIY